ncbi:MAG: DedA family protein, partial [Elusimicrobiota bacterium]
MDQLRLLLDVFLHLDRHLNAWAAQLGGWLYLVLFGVVFCETGLVVTPFLPGDSLLFAVGALSAMEGSPIRLPQVIALLCSAAILGDAVNYAIGYRVGPKIFHREDSLLLNKEHLLRTRRFYEKHGGKTIILARFIPIIRTFAPFVAGMGGMQYRRFFLYNVAGAVLWVALCVSAGYFFGNIPVVKKNFSLAILA